MDHYSELPSYQRSLNFKPVVNDLLPTRLQAAILPKWYAVCAQLAGDDAGWLIRDHDGRWYLWLASGWLCRVGRDRVRNALAEMRGKTPRRVRKRKGDLLTATTIG